MIRITTSLKATEMPFKVFPYFDHTPIGAKGNEDYAK
jgi:hypothetical protein